VKLCRRERGGGACHQVLDLDQTIHIGIQINEGADRLERLSFELLRRVGATRVESQKVAARQTSTGFA
jgi:hypothetical protein